ncbi:aminoglycoside phosphotransferase family protein [Phenylobacterium sp.]|uniref:aminoglycoside phosphotransferase family protein n=1 Tax=Phenylobacterium sp. TaxID=1871053 RepID=UPI002F91FBC1
MTRNAQALGGASARWVETLPALVAGLSRDWSLTLGPTLHGGSSSYVAEAQTADGEAAVLKVAMADYEPIAGEVATLELAQGRGYARLLAADLSRGALLTERLGLALGRHGYGLERRMQALGQALRAAWRPLAHPPTALMSGAEKAAWHVGFAPQTWEATGRPCSERLLDLVLAFAQRRGGAYAAEAAMLLHGDPHEANALADPAAPGGFRFVDPDGLYAEPAFDVGALLRDWTDELLTADPLALGRSWCEQLASLTGVPVEAAWEWAVIERTSTGLLLMKLGAEAEGRRTLAVAEAWAKGSA